MKRVAGSVAFTLRAHVATILLAALAIGVLSAGIRHVESGLACADRAVCYGQIGHTQAAGAPAIDARRALTPQSWAKRAHRLLASALVVLALALVYRTRKAGLRSGPAAVIPLTMVALLLALAIVGPMSHLKTLPGIATVNLLGGTALAALAWRLLLTLAPETRYRSTSVLRHGTRIALLLLVLQIVSGAWVSANFAGLACSGLPGCIDTPAVAVAPSAPALAPARELALDPAGRVVTDATAFTINTLHRVGALASALALGLACLLAARARIPARSWMPLALLLALQCALGVGTLATTLALPLTLAHGLLSTLLLLAALRFDHALQDPTGGTLR
ncbi:MAG: Heme A synthase [Pseudomonadales bacterium]|nr:Heme A synthase [Pseudomonadales bacterium]